MKIAVDENRITICGRAGGTVRFTDIAEVAAEKMDKVTYEEVFLIVQARTGEVITLGELDEDFAQAEQVLRMRLEGFSENWWQEAEQRPAGLRAKVWQAAA
ncbi:hypothetical protein M8312_13255 [Sphingomonas sp. KRR8]|uniref:hypothetical protein n=1 Tax=Sphingomonas sp. KRR8 TaxID=2942996 RepID=UPI0020215B61|nr:hypothetical protein [Sphingomonas sp. KRR8]URD60726.1 hypothetical protein M8312_13255 [Sphingomonas sp. KRR8]